jgi:hypothetical protein
MHKTLNRNIPGWLVIAAPLIIAVSLLILGMGGPAGAIDTFKALGGATGSEASDGTGNRPAASPTVVQSATPNGNNVH